MSGSDIVNICIGNADVEYKQLSERPKIDIDEDQETVDYLSQIEYVVDVHLPKAALAPMLRRTAVTYARGESDTGGLSTADFETILTTATTDHANIFIVADEAGRSFDIDAGKEVMARMPSQLKANFVTNVNGGADNVKLHSNLYPSLHDNKVPLLVDVNGKTVLHSNLDVTYDNTMSDKITYDDRNVLAASIPKCLSSQMEGFADDENVLRIITKPSDYFNLVTFGANGSSVQSSGVSKFSDVISSNISVAGSVNRLFETLSADDRHLSPAADQELGHLIMAAIFNEEPPPMPNVNCSVNGVPGNLLWNALDGRDINLDNDKIMLDNSSLLEKTYRLQFVLRTSTKVIGRDGNVLTSTTKSPNVAGHPDGKAEILYNFIFDRTNTKQTFRVNNTTDIEVELNTLIEMGEGMEIVQ